MEKSEEELRVEILKKAYITANPNPERKGCPEPKVLRDIAFHREIGTQEQFEQIMDHLTQCSACVRDHMAFVEEFKEKKKQIRNIKHTLLGLVAVLVIGVAIGAVWFTRSKQEFVVNHPEPKQQDSRILVPPVTENPKSNPPLIAKLESVVIRIPAKLRGPADIAKPIVLPRGNLSIEFRMPIGSPSGIYKMRILDNADKALLDTERTASKMNGIISFSVPLDTSTQSPGNYRLSIQSPGFAEWSAYVFKLR